MRNNTFALAIIPLTAALASCGATAAFELDARTANIANFNISERADNFAVVRHIILRNAVTREIEIEVTDLCAVWVGSYDPNMLHIICQRADGGVVQERYDLRYRTLDILQPISSFVPLDRRIR